MKFSIYTFLSAITLAHASCVFQCSDPDSKYVNEYTVQACDTRVGVHVDMTAPLGEVYYNSCYDGVACAIPSTAYLNDFESICSANGGTTLHCSEDSCNYDY
jgi:hypothetical protein